MSNSTTETKLRAYLRRLASSRRTGTVSADDVYTFLSKNNIRMSQNQRIALTRRVLNEGSDSEFVVSGFAPSSRPTAKGREVAQWEIA